MTLTTILAVNICVCLLCWTLASVQSFSTVNGSKVELKCTYRIPKDGKGIQWIRILKPDRIELSYNDMIFNNSNIALEQRLAITGNHGDGEYNLMISDVKKTDEGEWRCYLYQSQSGEEEEKHQLVVIVGPTIVEILNKTNKTSSVLNGTEGQDFNIRCTAYGGDPAPEMTLTIGSEVTKANNLHTIDHTISSINRSYDGVIVTCQAGYSGVTYTPKTDTATIRLKLKPLVPTFNLNSVSVTEGQMLVITCSSSGSRPAAVFRWEIGGVNITGSSEITRTTIDPSSNTFTVVSHLTYILKKDQNRQELICKAINPAAPGGVPAVPITVDVKYPPTVIVDSKTVTEAISLVALTCNTDGNPNITTNYEWTHETLKGMLIRRLNGTTSTLSLTNVNSSLHYQNTGRYNCTVGNGIPDTATRRAGSGVLTVHAPPVFAFYNSLTQGGERGTPGSISVDVYSVPSPLTVQWYRGNTLVSGSGYRPSSSPTAVRVMFHGKEVEVDGFRVTLTIDDVKKSDFTTFRLSVENNRGSKEQNIVFISISQPDPPTNLTMIDETDSSLTLQWTAGYDGGYEQTFFMVYRQQGTNTWTTVTGPKEGVSGSSDGVHQFVISGLKHSTTYEIKMFAENQINKSAVTDVQIGVTKTKVEGGSTGAIVGGVAGGLTACVTILIIVLVIIKFRNKPDGCKKSLTNRLRQKRESSFEGDYGLKDNILYQSVDSENKPQEPCVYAEVQKTNAVYAEVKKPEQQKKANEKNKKGVDNSSFEEYANQSDYAKNENSTGGYRNADGLKYVDVRFSNPPKGGKPVIHGLDERTIYSDVDHKNKAPPQEGAYELTDISHGK